MMGSTILTPKPGMLDEDAMRKPSITDEYFDLVSSHEEVHIHSRFPALAQSGSDCLQW